MLYMEILVVLYSEFIALFGNVRTLSTHVCMSVNLYMYYVDLCAITELLFIH